MEPIVYKIKAVDKHFDDVCVRENFFRYEYCSCLMSFVFFNNVGI